MQVWDKKYYKADEVILSVIPNAIYFAEYLNHTICFIPPKEKVIDEDGVLIPANYYIVNGKKYSYIFTNSYRELLRFGKVKKNEQLTLF